MPYRTKAVLETWVDEFRDQGHLIAGALDVVAQDGSDGSDTGLVVVRLDSISSDLYMQPVALGDPHWAVTLGARPDDVDFTPQQLLAFTAELAVAAALCTYLESRSLEQEGGLAAAAPVLSGVRRPA
ncbi:MAG: hypothetical protein Q7T71_10505 [Herbiconiux sp.]|nr:hypothetical protein [Herbiconiux sp.]